MNARRRPNWTCGRNTQVAKRKRERFIKALTKALAASFRTGQPVDLLDYMTPPQVWVACREAEAQGMTVGEWALDMIRRGMAAYEAAHP